MKKFVQALVDFNEKLYLSNGIQYWIPFIYFILKIFLSQLKIYVKTISVIWCDQLGMHCTSLRLETKIACSNWISGQCSGTIQILNCSRWKLELRSNFEGQAINFTAASSRILQNDLKSFIVLLFMGYVWYYKEFVAW